MKELYNKTSELVKEKEEHRHSNVGRPGRFLELCTLCVCLNCILVLKFEKLQHQFQNMHKRDMVGFEFDVHQNIFY